MTHIRVESVWQDVRYAVRALRRQPGFTLVALSILTAGIGLNTAVFTLFKEAILQPWSGVADPSRVVRVYGSDSDIGGLAGFSHPEYRYLAEHATSVTGLAAWRNDTVRFGDSGASDTRITLTTANFFHVLTESMERGRGFLAEEDAPGAPLPVAVLSADVWHRRLGGDPEVIGRTVRLDGIPFRVVGVAPQAFAGSEGSTTSVWIPLGAGALLRPNDPRARGIDDPRNCCSNVAGRLVPGMTQEQAASELALLSIQFRRAAGAKDRPVVVTATSMMPAREHLTVMMSGAVVFAALLLVLMLACANIGNLLLARGAARAREIGVRLSLGATRGRVVRQLLTESVVLSFAAGAAGLFFAMQAVPILRRIVGPAGGAAGETAAETAAGGVAGGAAETVAGTVGEIVAGIVANAAAVDWLVLLCTFAIAALTCLASGLAPALHATRPDVRMALSDGGGLTSARQSLRNVLLGIQIAVSVIFLACAGLFVRGVQKAYTIDLGFSLNDVMVAEIDLPRDAYDDARQSVFLHQVAAQLRTPGGPPIALASWEPLGGSQGGSPVRHPGQSAGDAKMVRTMGVSPEYFDVLRIPIVAGRNFAPDHAGGRSVIVNQRFAGLLWPGQDPIGKRFLSRYQDPVEREVIGVAKDVFTEDVGVVEPMFYTIFGSALEPKMLMRTTDGPALARISGVVAALDSRARLRLIPLAVNFSNEIAMTRRMAVMAGAFGTLALLLVGIGMFGIFAYVVRQRTREIGIRMALGAPPGDVVRLVLAGNARPVIVGALLGVMAAVGIARLLQRLLFGLSPFDPLAHAGVATLLVLTGLAASYVPVRRAVRVDPVVALRHE